MKQEICFRFWKSAILLLAFLAAVGEGHAQKQEADTAYRQSPLFKEGKNQVTGGCIALGLGVAGSLILSSLPKEERTGLQFSPSGKDVAAALTGLIGGIAGLSLLIRGLRNMHKAKTQVGIGYMSFQKSPGYYDRMPALTLHWRLGKTR